MLDNFFFNCWEPELLEFACCEYFPTLRVTVRYGTEQALEKEKVQTGVSAGTSGLYLNPAMTWFMFSI